MRSCPVCGDKIYSDDEGMLCYRCKDSGAHVRLEIYEKDPYNSPEDSFSKAFLKGPNFKDMQRKNIHRGGFS